jgi:hypothetical protein
MGSSLLLHQAAVLRVAIDSVLAPGAACFHEMYFTKAIGLSVPLDKSGGGDDNVGVACALTHQSKCRNTVSDIDKLAKIPHVRRRDQQFAFRKFRVVV